MFWRMLAEDARVWIIAAGVLALTAILLVRWIVRRQDERHARGVAAATTGANVLGPQPLPAPKREPLGREDLRRPGPFEWSSPPVEPCVPTWTRDAPSAVVDPGGFALEEVGTMHYRGTGIEPHRHPAGQHPTFGGEVRGTICGRCRSHKVLIIELSWNVHPYSGDCSWDFETRCTECGAFNRHAGSE